MTRPNAIALAAAALAALCVAAPWGARAAHRNRPAGLARFRGGRTIAGACARGPCIALTFDDGPDFAVTPRILDELARRSAQAAFFVVGRRIAGGSETAVRNRAVLLEAYRRGHLVGNHTYDHANLDEADPAAVPGELDTADVLIRRAIGERTWLFRPPYGAFAAEPAVRAAFERGYTPVLWELDSRDWSARSAAQVVANVRAALNRSPNGGVMLMHDTLERTADALPLVFEEIAARNRARAARGEAPYRFVGLDDFWRPMRQERNRGRRAER